MTVIDQPAVRVAPPRRALPTRPEGFRAPIIAGIALIVAFFVGFGAWAALAPLGTAAVASGTVVVDSKRKVIQHLEPGIVREILVRDSDRVEAGQVLVRLDDTQARANLQLVATRYHGALALAARLSAEALDRDRIEFPAELLDHRDDPDVRKSIEAQTSIFEAKLAEYRSQADVLRQRDAQIGEEVRGLQGQIAAQDRQLALIAEEVVVAEEMFAKGLTQKPRILLLKRQAAEIDGARGQNVAAIARARQTMADTELRLSELHTARINDAVEAYGDNQKDLFDFAQQLRTAQDVLDRIDIRAPLAGIVVNRTMNSPGGVINAGEPLMELVPNLDRLVIEAKLDVNDIDKVRPGLPAQLRFTAFSRRTIPTIDGRVLWVAADRTDDEKARQSYYLCRIEADQDQLDALPALQLHAGMPVEVMIITAQRTALDYLLAPIERLFTRGMKEP